jgi:HEAT repeat protein
MGARFLSKLLNSAPGFSYVGEGYSPGDGKGWRASSDLRALVLGCLMVARIPVASFKTEGNLAHVFISYVRENRDAVDRLANELRTRGVTVWLDRNDIYPGARWKDAIEKAISSGNFFIACFSAEYKERDETYMSEELTIVIDKLRKRPSDKSWFIPVFINDTQIPSRRISSVEKLSDIQAVNLHEDWETGVNIILRILRYDDPILARTWKLLDILEGPFVDERLHAIKELGNLRVAEKMVIVALINAAKDNDRDIRKAFEIRKASLKALVNIGPAAVPALVAALRDSDIWLREGVAKALGEIGSPAAEAVPALAAALNDPEKDVRRNAAQALGGIGSPAAEAIPALAAALNDPEKDVRRNAAQALGEIGPAAVPALVAALNDPDELVRESVKVALAWVDLSTKESPKQERFQWVRNS